MRVRMMSRRVPRGPVIDVMVTKEIIATAVPRDSGYCMIAEAVQVAYPDAGKVLVDLQTIRVPDPKRGLKYIYLTPRIAQQALVDFDQGIEVEPFPMRLRAAHVIIERSPEQIARKAERQRIYRLPPEEREAARAALGIKPYDRPRLRSGPGGSLPQRFGGSEPPLQKTRDGVVYSRRREFGLRRLSR